MINHLSDAHFALVVGGIMLAVFVGLCIITAIVEAIVAAVENRRERESRNNYIWIYPDCGISNKRRRK